MYKNNGGRTALATAVTLLMAMGTAQAAETETVKIGFAGPDRAFGTPGTGR